MAKNLPRSDCACRFLTLHGRWKSLEAKNMYVKEPGERRLWVTKVLGFVALFLHNAFSVSITCSLARAVATLYSCQTFLLVVVY